MRGYVQSAMHKFQHHPPRRRQHAPHPWIKPTYGQKQQFVNEIQSPPLSKIETTRIQAIVGTFLYYARAIDDNVLVALNSIGTQQSAPTLDTKAKTLHLLNYLATHPDHTLRCHASEMIMHIDSDAAYIHILWNQRPKVEQEDIFISPHTTIQNSMDQYIVYVPS